MSLHQQLIEAACANNGLNDPNEVTVRQFMEAAEHRANHSFQDGAWWGFWTGVSVCAVVGLVVLKLVG